MWRIGGEVRVVFNFWKICSQSSFHVNRVDFFRSWTMGWVCSASLGRKREMVVRRPMRHYSSLTLLGLRISMIALQFSGLASIPRWVTMSALGGMVVLRDGGMRLACKASSRRRDLGTFKGAYLVKRGCWGSRGLESGRGGCGVGLAVEGA